MDFLPLLAMLLALVVVPMDLLQDPISVLRVKQLTLPMNDIWPHLSARRTKKRKRKLKKTSMRQITTR